MEKKFENVTELATRKEYDNAMSYVMQLMNEATVNGSLSDPEADNEYISEIGSIGHICAAYEDTKMEFKNFKIRKGYPLFTSAPPLCISV